MTEARPAPHGSPSADNGAIVYIGVGANLGDAAHTVAQALASLAALEGILACQAASLYRSAPIDSDGPDYVNTVARVRTRLAPLALLDALQRIELEYGRERPYRNAPRTLDLDILLYGDKVMHEERLIVPHPRMHERAFVLAPLVELAPDIVLAQGPAGALLAQLDQDLSKLHASAPNQA